ncbi:oligosaccharide flippase family protein [Seonamhaeicola algicola]|uniref:Oligosaccharide flippase family protein n=1 Tax=Seonamhaeicola algicola TaxID=1719036 RepID=A0A5C7AXU4_9FLAO|nr:oligosaccharide flippase family protein [Seonamhaeicola algicola]TXE12997.1 oligosaccharide flippase family protein [Seonamhaeicola algicola]
MISKLIKNSSIYSVLMLLQKGINFILIPVLTVYLSTYDYGVVAVVLAINAFLNVFYLLALHGTLNRFYYEYKDNELMVKKLFGTIITFILFNSVVVTLILLLGRKWLLNPFLGDVSFSPYMILGLISVVLNPCYTIYQNSLQARQEGIRYGKNNAAFFLVNISLVLLSVTVFNLGAKGVLGSLAVTNIIFFIYTLFSFKNNIVFGVDKKLLKKSLKYAFPLIPHTLSGVATMLIDRILINKLLNASLTGVYSIGNNFGSVVFLIASGINQAFVPWFNQKVKANDVDDLGSVSKALILFYCLIALGLSFFGKEVIMFVTPKPYHISWQVIPFISFAFVYHGVYYFFAGSLFYDIQGRGNRIIPIATISAAVLNIVLNVTLIPMYGINGAAISTLMTKIALAISLKFFYTRYLKINYPDLFLLLVPFVFFIISLFSFYQIANFWIKLLLYLAIVLIIYIVMKNKVTTVIKLLKK